MQFTQRIEAALETAALVHAGQLRKGNGASVLTHLVATAWLVSEHTSDEDVIVAALLHDALEDTEYQHGQLIQQFGERVAQLVSGVTIAEAVGNETWHHDGSSYVHALLNAPAESAVIAAADKLHNFSNILREYGADPERFRKDFRGTPQNRIALYDTMVAAIFKRLEECPQGYTIKDALMPVWENYRAYVVSLT
jgi:GTP diphosphokinase / guanosine-3',5'-bis(diphosphate) 3'-diphosphatase